jgi:TPR repeat protein
MREQSAEDVSRDSGRAANESKYTEFKMGCDEGNAAVCTALGEWWAMMRGDFVKAVDLYGPACATGRVPQACLNLGQLMAEGRPGVSRDAEAASRALILGCELGSAQACAEGGALLVRASGRVVVGGESGSGGGGGGGVGSDGVVEYADVSPTSPLARAALLFRRGCDSGTSTTHARNCGLLAALALSPRTAPALSPRVPQNAEIIALLDRACAGEHAASCIRLASSYRSGLLGLEKDTDKANTIEIHALMLSGVGERQAKTAVETKNNKKRNQ